MVISMSNGKRHIMESLNINMRYDGRKLEEYRPVSVEYNVVNSAEGSARVKIGGTEVIAGIKMSMDKPFSDTPDEGTLMVGVELLPMSNPEFELGPPGIQAVELARVVDRGIREAKAIDVKKMVVVAGEKVWGVSVDIVSINDEGNLFDACALAAIAALKVTRFPSYDGKKVDYDNYTDQKLHVVKTPVSATVVKIGDKLLVDPTTEEELMIDARLTVATDEKGEICAMQKGGATPLTLAEVDRMMQLAVAKCNELRKHL